MSLRAEGLRRVYGRVTAVDGVSLAVPAGSVLAVIGPNGAGKSTLFRLLAGLEHSESGQVLLGGTDVTRWPLHRRVQAGLAWMPQHASVLPRLSVRANLALVPGVDVAAALEEADLSLLADQLAGTLSGGQRRRLELARCIAARPLVALLDEPFAGVEPVRVARWGARIRGLAESGAAVVLSDHAVGAALAVSDQVLLLDGGQAVARGTPAEVAADSIARERYLGPGFPGVRGGGPLL